MERCHCGTHLVITIDVETGMNNVGITFPCTFSSVNFCFWCFCAAYFFGNRPPNIAGLQTIAHATIQMMENLPVLIRSARGDAFDLDNVTDVQDVVVQLLCTHMLLEVFVNCNVVAVSGLNLFWIVAVRCFDALKRELFPASLL